MFQTITVLCIGHVTIAQWCGVLRKRGCTYSAVPAVVMNLNQVVCRSCFAARLVYQFVIYFMSAHRGITAGSLTDLLLARASPKLQPTLQILGYQTSDYNPKEIILRVSDSEAFLDCILVGPYSLGPMGIQSTEYAHNNQHFKTCHLVRVIDYFCKIDHSKMCPLRIIIRKLEEQQPTSNIIGHPQEISQLLDNRQGHAAPLQQPQTHPNHMGSQDTPIKIEQNAEDQPYHIVPQAVHPPHPLAGGSPSGQEEPLSLNEIMSNQQGYFIGRLVRVKYGSKEAKDGPMSFLYLGFVDINGELVRVHLAGRIAIRQARELRKGKCYYVKGLQLFQGDKSKGPPQIRLKEKDYRIQQIQNESITGQYKPMYFRWEHENEWVESEMVDVIGLVGDIEQKITYKNANTFQEQRDVVRLVLYNSHKTVKISFWADHIHILESMNLRKKQAIVLEDIKKKKSVFLDFTAESNILLLDNHPQLKEQLEPLLPPEQEAPDPTNVQELLEVYELEPYSNKIRTLRLQLVSLNAKWLFYRMCNACKKKVERVLDRCPECDKDDFVYKFNCPMEFSDQTGSLNCVAFDPACQQLFNRSADQLSQTNEGELRDICHGLTRKDYRASIENKNNRLIVRGIETAQTSCSASECGNMQASQPVQIPPPPPHSDNEAAHYAPSKLQSSPPGLKQQVDNRMSE